ncbi:MAG TPA: hypothetical protein ENH10_02625, partial [Bacteroidetes bacterium]|nr:hypothetical protein [Bacteroidota bacterium]HEX04035.1 hypothetical protein [Bacteroidota bacterium]
MTVGAVNDVLNYTGPGSVLMSSFSSYGPTDDGRIKPDIVANGVNLRSTGEANNTDYATMSGTSMSSPSAAGTLNLLFIHYDNVFGEEPLSTTLRGLVLHTADECGSWDGPDYRYGWGLMNALAAADHITWASVNSPAIQERELEDGSTYVQDLARFQDEDIRVTIIWNEPMGPNHAIPGDQTPVLVNDLDIRLEDADNGTIYYPWVLGGIDNPDTPATTGDNIVDNVEQIWIEAPAGENYQLTVSHKGTLSETVSYTLLISGLIDSADPREPVTNLTGESNYGDQTIQLDWDHPGGDTFQHYRVVRDGSEIGTTTETTYSDDVAGFGTFVYEVVPVYNEGESLQNPTVDVLFAEPVPASFFSYRVIDEPSRQIELMWEQTRAQETIYDDGEAEQPGLSFVESLPLGIIAAQLFDVDDFSSLRGIRVELNSTAGFGDFRFVLLEYEDNPTVPGDVFWSSETLLATEAGWFDFDMPFRFEFQSGDKVWIGLEWLENGMTSMNVDNVTTYPADRASLYISVDGVTWNWVPLNQFPAPGTYTGNLMLRGVFGHMESAGTNGMTEFNVTRDGNDLATGITETTLAETLPSDDIFEYVIESVYLQGNAFSETLTIDASSLGVDDDVALPSEFAIGDAYP